MILLFGLDRIFIFLKFLCRAIEPKPAFAGAMKNRLGNQLPKSSGPDWITTSTATSAFRDPLQFEFEIVDSGW